MIRPIALLALGIALRLVAPAQAEEAALPATPNEATGAINLIAFDACRTTKEA